MSTSDDTPRHQGFCYAHGSEHEITTCNVQYGLQPVTRRQAAWSLIYTLLQEHHTQDGWPPYDRALAQPQLILPMLALLQDAASETLDLAVLHAQNQGLSQRQIGELLGITRQAVAKRWG